MDMVTMNIVDSTMVSICREMGITMMKTSYSTIFNEGLDFTCGLGNTRGELIGVAEYNPLQIGGLPLVLHTAVQEIPQDTLEDGDVLVHNYPYRGGMHTPEHTFIKPIFVDDVLYGFAIAIGRSRDGWTTKVQALTDVVATSWPLPRCPERLANWSGRSDGSSAHSSSKIQRP